MKWRTNIPSFSDDQIDEVGVYHNPATYRTGRCIQIDAGNGCENGSAFLTPETAIEFAQAILKTVTQSGLPGD